MKRISFFCALVFFVAVFANANKEYFWEDYVQDQPIHGLISTISGMVTSPLIFVYLTGVVPLVNICLWINEGCEISIERAVITITYPVNVLIISASYIVFYNFISIFDLISLGKESSTFDPMFRQWHEPVYWRIYEDCCWIKHFIIEKTNKKITKQNKKNSSINDQNDNNRPDHSWSIKKKNLL